MTHGLIWTVCTVSTLVILGGSAGFADEPPAPAAPSWTQERDQIVSVDSSDAGDNPNFYSFIRIISVSDGEGPVVQLGCQATTRGDHTLQAAIKLDPANTYEQAPKTRLRLLSMTGVLTIDGDRKSETFQYHPDSSKITPLNRTVPRRLFNAIVRGDKIHLKARNTTYNLELPGPDAVFTAFAKICPVTNGGKFDQSIIENFLNAQSVANN
mgnify:CR=1 FL=1|tara:strand:- start:136 stop:768 length:633 start_codon:yes stop_codon:yes gene_type:complete